MGRETLSTRNKSNSIKPAFSRNEEGGEVRLGTHNLFTKVSTYVLKGKLVRSNVSKEAGYAGYTSNKPFCQVEVDYEYKVTKESWCFSSI